MKKMSLLIFASCALMTACAEHDKCYEETSYARPEVIETTECGCHKAPVCGCQQKSSCGCHKKAPCGCSAVAPVIQPVMPMMQPKTVVVVVPAKQQPQPQRHILTPEIVYPEPRPCGCRHK